MNFKELTLEDVYGKSYNELLELINISEEEWNFMSEVEQLNYLGIPLNKWVNLPDYLYHCPITPGLSSSGMKLIQKKTPYHYITKKKEGDTSSKDALILGRAIHTYVLEGPEVFNKEFYIIPNDVRKNTAKWNKHKEDAINRELIKEKDYEVILGIANSLDKSGYLSLLRSGKNEQALFAYDEKRNIVIRIKADAVLDKIVLDLKTTRDASDEAFAKTVVEYGYDLQHWLYLKTCEIAGFEKAAFAFVAVEKEKPYAANGLIIQPEDVTYYSTKVAENVLDIYSYCIKTGNWYGYEFDVHQNKKQLFKTIELPNWYKYSVEEQTGFEG